MVPAQLGKSFEITETLVMPDGWRSTSGSSAGAVAKSAGRWNKGPRWKVVTVLGAKLTAHRGGPKIFSPCSPRGSDLSNRKNERKSQCPQQAEAVRASRGERKVSA
jgi:hypothetical protein